MDKITERWVPPAKIYTLVSDLCSAFKWSSTPQGSAYWDDVIQHLNEIAEEQRPLAAPMDFHIEGWDLI